MCRVLQLTRKPTPTNTVPQSSEVLSPSLTFPHTEETMHSRLFASRYRRQQPRPRLLTTRTTPHHTQSPSLQLELSPWCPRNSTFTASLATSPPGRRLRRTFLTTPTSGLPAGQASPLSRRASTQIAPIMSQSNLPLRPKSSECSLPTADGRRTRISTITLPLSTTSHPRVTMAIHRHVLQPMMLRRVTVTTRPPDTQLEDLEEPFQRPLRQMPFHKAICSLRPSRNV